MDWNSQKIREQFLQFFESKRHEIVSSAPMVVKNDPTLMFTNAGMNQFKDFFLGNAKPKNNRVADTQKCLRVSGKHNDLEEVGVDTYHHTMFEMLGNWSFGDYFKEEAITWAWELLTEVYKIEKSRLYVTVFEGDQQDGTAFDQESYDIWKRHIEEHRIIKANKKDNFWEMGDTGPCGPCSEIHVDIRSDEERSKVDGKSLVNQDHPQVIEVWNLVFMQFNRMANRELKPLPEKHVDTGMGFERLCMVLQGKTSNYDTDVFSGLISKMENLSGLKYEATDGKKDVAIRVIADHIRAISFSIADGQLPSNTGAGYVIRRILRRAVRYGYSFLDLKSPFLFQLVSILVKEMGNQFEELVKQEVLIAKVIKEEEESFLRTLEKGISKFNDYKERHKQIKGEFAFELYDTFGFPIDLTQLMAAENGMLVDMKGFEAALQEQKDRSRKATNISAGDWVVLLEDEREEFIGYDYTSAKVKITRYREVNIKGKKQFQLVFNLTPFYPEGGGQVGDTGHIEANGNKVSILNTKKENNLILHFSKELPSDLEAEFLAVVHEGNRKTTANNHTATHLLHEALREVLGEHVEQKGSLVHPKYLRFDFSHFQKVTNEELKDIERLVNTRIRSNFELEERRDTPMEEAQKMGAMALFGEKYGDVVRVIKFGNSVELCGGTHVKATGQIGLFKITSESAVAAGIRRIEAISGEFAEEHVNRLLDVIDELGSMLNNNKDLSKAVNELLSKNNTLKKKVEAFELQEQKLVLARLKNEFKDIGGINYLSKEVELSSDAIKNVAFRLKADTPRMFLVLGSKIQKTTITVVISDDLAKEKGLHAGNIVRELAKEIKGGGGGQPFFATAGGKDPNGLTSALDKALAFIK